MNNKKITDVLLERIKYFINSIENGEYDPKGYEFTIKIPLDFTQNISEQKYLTISDSYSTLEK